MENKLAAPVVGKNFMAKTWYLTNLIGFYVGL